MTEFPHGFDIENMAGLGYQIQTSYASNCKEPVWFEIPSGKRLHNYGKSPCIQWENPLFLWPFSSSLCWFTRGYFEIEEWLT